ncbi:MAG: RNA polymerase-binding protein DksA [Deltaproteobacteria bacterium]|nr:RNA polymerase-binding protein DksA [Deltaproteobacteria bacterium]
MNETDLKWFKKLLIEWLGQLLDQSNLSILELMKPVDDSPDAIDRAVREQGRNFTLRLRDRERKLVRKIKHALERIEEGAYGICEKCGEEITVERLKARPVTVYCLHCKAENEALKKASGL